MLGGIHEFRREFERRDIELLTPSVEQVLPVPELLRTVPTVDGWIAGDDPVSRDVLTAGRRGRLRAVVKWGVGVDNVDFQAARDLGLPITNTPGMFGPEVADVAVSYVVALARETFGIDRQVRQGDWPKPRGISLAGRTVALVGFGDIGRAVARRLLVAGMTVVAYDPRFTPAPDLSQVQLEHWPSRLGEADFLVFTCALTTGNRRMLNATTLALTRPGVRIINVSRGPLIDERALVESLRTGHVHSAALDVFEEEPLPMESPLRAFDRCIFGSHNASNTVDAVRRTSQKAIDLLFEMLGRVAS